MPPERIVDRTGAEHWFNPSGLLHRTDGPAVVYPDGNHSWWLNGERLTFEQWLNKLDTAPRNRTLLALKWCEVNMKSKGE